MTVDLDFCNEGVLSDLNFSAFLDWLYRGSAPAAEKANVAQTVYTIEHRGPQASPITLHVNGEEIRMAALPCSTPGCARCSEGRGGYQFKWISSHWTRRHYLANGTSTPNELRMAAMQFLRDEGLRPMPCIQPGIYCWSDWGLWCSATGAITLVNRANG